MQKWNCLETVQVLVAGGHTSGEEGTDSKNTLPSLTHLALTTEIQIYPFTT